MIALTSLLHANSNKTNIIQSDYQCFCSSVNAAENHNPIDFFLRCSNPGLGSPLVNKSPSCSVVDILSNLIPCFTISSQNQIFFVWLCLLWEVNWDSKVLARTRVPALSSWIETWMVVLPTGRPMALPMILTPSMIGNSLWQLWARATISASIVDRLVSDCYLDCHMIEQLATIITYPVLLLTQTGSTITLCPYILTKLASWKLSIFKTQQKKVWYTYTRRLHNIQIPVEKINFL